MELSISRLMLAEWYNLTISGLRSRFKTHGVHLKNRVLTISDVQYVISKCGIPSNIPDDVAKLVFRTPSVSIT